MKKFFILFIAGIILFILIALVSIRLMYKNYGNFPDANEQNITKVNSEENPSNFPSDIIEPDLQAIKNAAVFSLIYPVDGEIELPYSPDTLLYSKTLKEWTTHNGIDIRASRGTPVKSAETGTVENITESADKGIEITISHGNGYKTIYANLSSNEMVKIGQSVEKAQVISGIGNTSSFEYYEPDHLHFEVIKDGKHINPVDVLKHN